MVQIGRLCTLWVWTHDVCFGVSGLDGQSGGLWHHGIWCYLEDLRLRYLRVLEYGGSGLKWSISWYRRYGMTRKRSKRCSEWSKRAQIGHSQDVRMSGSGQYQGSEVWGLVDIMDLRS